MSDIGTTPLKNFFDGIAFLNKYPLLSKATSDDDVPIPGYLLTEINKITFESEAHRLHLLEFLITRLTRDAPNVRLKTLKILHHIAKNGHREFCQLLRKKDGALKDVADYTPPVDSIRHQDVYANIRKEAQNVLLYIFSSEADTSANNDAGSAGDEVQPGTALQLSGMGSSIKAGKYDGFGNAPIQVPKSVTEKVVGSLSGAVEKLIKSPESEAETIHRTLKTVDSGSYLPVKVTPLTSIPEEPSPSKPNTTSRRKHKRAHKPGRAGGGWEEDGGDQGGNDDDSGCPEHRTDRSSQQSVMSSDSLERLDLSSSTDWSAEISLVEEFLASALEDLPTRAEIQSMNKRCSRLNCDKIVEILSGKLPGSTAASQMRILLCVETLLHSELAPVDVLAAALVDNLTLVRDSSPTSALQIKATKILLILEKCLRYLNHSSVDSPDSAVKSPSVDLEESNNKTTQDITESPGSAFSQPTLVTKLVDDADSTTPDSISPVRPELTVIKLEFSPNLSRCQTNSETNTTTTQAINNSTTTISPEHNNDDDETITVIANGNQEELDDIEITMSEINLETSVVNNEDYCRNITTSSVHCD